MKSLNKKNKEDTLLDTNEINIPDMEIDPIEDIELLDLDNIDTNVDLEDINLDIDLTDINLDIEDILKDIPTEEELNNLGNDIEI